MRRHRRAPRSAGRALGCAVVAQQGAAGGRGAPGRGRRLDSHPGRDEQGKVENILPALADRLGRLSDA